MSSRSSHLGQLQELLQPGLVYLKLTTPLGDAAIDPFAAAQDSRTQQIMQALGLGVEIGFGPVPAIADTSSLRTNLTTLMTYGIGAVVVLAIFRGMKSSR